MSNEDLQGWLLVFISSTACMLGASVVFIDKCNCWSAGRNTILENQSFLAASMALASGVLLFSSLAVLLPASRQRLSASKSYLLYLCFFGGALFTLGLTKVIHALTPDAIHACGGPPSSPCDMEHDSSSSSEEEEHLYNNDEESNVPGPNQHSHHQQQQDNNRGEHQPIISKLNNSQVHGHDYGSTNHHHSHHHHPQLFREAHFRFHPHSHHHHHHEHEHEHSDAHHDHNTHHQHEFQNQKSDLLRIGIQTAVAIGVHKFPEGLIMFISNKASEKLGWAVAAAMSIHNLTEGFMIALPLYLALKSRTAAFGWAALLGGLSQPIGALLGLLLMRNIDSDKENLMFGITFAVVSGMMTLITIQSMLPQAIKADTNHRYVLPFFFLGIFFVGLTAVLKSL